MTVYFNFYSQDVVGKYNVTSPSTNWDSQLRVRRGVVDFSKQSVAATQVANAVKLFPGDIVHDVYCRVITAESTTNGAVDVGFNGGAEVAADFDIETANNFNSNVTLVPTLFVANNAVTLTPNNGVACNSGKVEVMVVLTKSSFDQQINMG